ncbi:phage replisome organizer, putative, N-terminal region [Streptococcus equinus]|uniref:DnaD domain protein n=1 Tax=Streptococcus equinus TaxID=1335 RepID=UPI0008B454A7|nr:DnaD domain protein [Streptococcus equinus]SEK38102.1 phage replisome organizer, putative, N-terminal region [Streptococcus equinus]
MAEKKTKTKVYFWLKVDKKFFENVFIKRLKNMNGGYAMTVIYIRLMLESLESDCILYYDGFLESLVEELAIKLDVSEDDINMTMAYFTKCGLIQIDTEGNAELPQARAMLKSETNWAKYKREEREVGQIPTQLDNVQLMSNQCPTEIEIDIEKEIEHKSKNKSKSKNQNKNNATADFSEIYSYYQQEIGVLSPNQAEQLADYIKLDNFEPELLKRAIDKASNNAKRSFGYVNSILRNWKQNGITTLVQAEEEDRKFHESKQQPAKSDIESTIPDDLPF